MVKKIIFFIIFFYFLIIIQTSFLVHFSIFGLVPNLVLLSVIFINLFFLGQESALISAVIGGLCLDIFSLSGFLGFFGSYTLLLTGFYLFLKLFLKQYVRIPIIKKP
ncbi:MAG: hypothetical protein FJZ05_02130 [Candidatus Nealsonbacteria bacterium]|nr:hypothetical protein [Candidatus Nealsonbacteria bacterium]